MPLPFAEWLIRYEIHQVKHAAAKTQAAGTPSSDSKPAINEIFPNSNAIRNSNVASLPRSPELTGASVEKRIENGGGRPQGL